MPSRLRSRPLAGFIEPCLPRPADRPPAGSDWLHEIKHDGFRIMALRDAAGVRLLTRNGNDFSRRFPLAVAAIAALPARSCLIDGEAIVTDQKGLDSRAKCNRALREPDLHVFAKLFEDCLKRSLEAQAFSGREIGGDDDVLDFLVGHFVDVDLTRQPAS
jgi:ATP dependent DNA ligase-like protein